MKKSILFIGAALMLASSCGKFLDVTPPNNIIDEQIMKLFEDGDDATRANILKGIAGPMVSYFNFTDINGEGTADPIQCNYQGLEWGNCLRGNDIVLGSNVNDLNDLAGKGYYLFNYDYTQPNVKGSHAYWYGYALAINKANMVLDYMDLFESMITANAAMKKVLDEGRLRALTVRAYSYLCLMEEYQQPYTNGGQDKLGMSLYTTYDPLQETKARSSATDTYKFIIADLDKANDLVKSVGTAITTDRTELEDFDPSVINFVRARAALEFGDYKKCIEACNVIINSGKYDFIKEANWGGRNSGTWTETGVEIKAVDNAFYNLKNNPECILGYIRTSSYKAGNQHCGLANCFGSYAASGTTGRIDDRLYNKIADDDFRKDAFHTAAVGDVQIAGAKATVKKVPSYINLKYATTQGITDDGKEQATRAKGEELYTNVEYCKFRLSEVYLMKAEAQLADNDEAGAKVTINEILKNRTKAGAAETLTIDNYPGTAGLSTLQKIQLQWRIEMWGEGGREYHNNKRWGIDVDRTGSTLHLENTKYSWKKMTRMIPQREIEDNPLCVQND